MLIISQPKSASTSLLQTLAAMFKVTALNGMSRNANYPNDCPGFETIQKYHGTMVARDESFFKYWLNKRDKIYKEHILPTEKHVAMLKRLSLPFVLLLRNPEHSFDNYVRLRQAYIDGKISQRSNSILHAEQFVNFDMEGLRRDLLAFYEGWRAADVPTALRVEYDDLVLRYNETMKKICAHLGKPNVKIIQLVRALGNRGLYSTYTGVGERRLRGQS